MPVPDSPSWHDAKPGPNCSAEELRFWSIREIGKLHETSRLAGSHIHGLLKEVRALRSLVEPKAEATAVASELDRLRADCAKEFGTIRTEFDKSDLENAVGRLADLHKELGEQTQTAFRQVRAVEASLQGHVSQGFTEAVGALQWLEGQTSARLVQLETQVVQLQATVDTPPPPAPAAERRVASAPVLNLRANLSGCAAGPFACGCGAGATRFCNRIRFVQPLPPRAPRCQRPGALDRGRRRRWRMPLPPRHQAHGRSC